MIGTNGELYDDRQRDYRLLVEKGDVCGMFEK